MRLRRFCRNLIGGGHTPLSKELIKILFADFDRPREFDAFMENFTASKNMMIAYAGAMNDEEGDTHMIIAFHEPPFDKITLYRFGTYNEGDAFAVFECEEGLDI
jgi:hypothetical protein